MRKIGVVLLLLPCFGACDESDGKPAVETGATVLENQFGQYHGDAFLNLWVRGEWKMDINVVFIGKQRISLKFSSATWAGFLAGAEMEHQYLATRTVFTDGSVLSHELPNDPRVVGCRLAQRNPMIIELALYEGPTIDGQIPSGTARLVGAFGVATCHDEAVGGMSITTACLDGFRDAKLDDFKVRLVPALEEIPPQEH